METFNRKLNMIKITGLIILLFLVKHGNAKIPNATSTNPTSTYAATSLTVTTKSSTEKPTTSYTTPSLNDTNKLSTKMSSTSPLSKNLSTKTGPTKAIVPITTPTPTTTPPKAPDECYEISCNNKTCPVYENNTVNFPNDVKMCNRTNTGFCFVNKTVDSVNVSTVNITMGCNTKCSYKKDIVGCCTDNLCNGDLSLLMNHVDSEGQFVKYNLLLSLLCIAISLF